MRRLQKSSRAQEDDVAEAFGGKRQPGSGNQWHSKADVKTKSWLVECKVTESGSYSLKKADLQTLYIQAAMEGKTPMMEIRFLGNQPVNVVIVPLDVAKGMGLYGSD